MEGAIIRATACATLCKSASARNCCEDDESDDVETIPELELESELGIVSELVLEVLEDFMIRTRRKRTDK